MKRNQYFYIRGFNPATIWCILFTLLLSTTTAHAQKRLTVATGYHTNGIALGLETNVPFRNTEGRILAAPLPLNNQKYTAGPMFILSEQPRLGTEIYTAQNLSLDLTPTNWDWGTYHSIGGRFHFHHLHFFAELAALWDVEPGWSGPVTTGTVFGLSADF